MFEDTATPGRFVETFHVESWLEHRRQPDRLTMADAEVDARVRRCAETPPKITHSIARSS